MAMTTKAKLQKLIEASRETEYRVRNNDSELVLILDRPGRPSFIRVVVEPAVDDLAAYVSYSSDGVIEYNQNEDAIRGTELREEIRAAAQETHLRKCDVDQFIAFLDSVTE